MRLCNSFSAFQIVTALVLTGFALTVSSGPAEAKTRNAKCDNGQSIQKKLDKSKDGDTVEVSGTCTESIVIRQDRVTVNCAVGSSITGVAGSSNTIQIRASDVVVTNCNINGGATTASAVTIVRAGSARLEGNVVSDGATNGIIVTQSSYGRLIGNEVTGNGSTGIGITSASMADLFDNNIHDNGSNGVTLSRSAAADIVGNSIVDNGSSGVLIIRTSSAAFSNDAVFGNAPNLIEGNDNRGIGCFDNSAVQFGASQNFGTGNGNPNGTGPNTLFEGASFCAVSGTP